MAGRKMFGGRVAGRPGKKELGRREKGKNGKKETLFPGFFPLCPSVSAPTIFPPVFHRFLTPARLGADGLGGEKRENLFLG